MKNFISFITENKLTKTIYSFVADAVEDGKVLRSIKRRVFGNPDETAAKEINKEFLEDTFWITNHPNVEIKCKFMTKDDETVKEFSYKPTVRDKPYDYAIYTEKNAYTKDGDWIDALDSYSTQELMEFKKKHPSAKIQYVASAYAIDKDGNIAEVDSNAAYGDTRASAISNLKDALGRNKRYYDMDK